MNKHVRVTALGAALFLCGALGTASAAPLVEQHAGSIAYVTGGVGDSEDAAIKQMMPQYSVSMTFAERQGDKAVYLADVPVSVRDSNGQTVLNIKTNGPYLLVRLPAGRYTLEASHQGRTESRSISVTSAHSSQAVVFEWS
ncbi:MAG: carboxypeptidase-like regulatory domain-containing protein [Burkholderiaceae bacterium]|jgi:hypothetical protein